MTAKLWGWYGTYVAGIFVALETIAIVNRARGRQAKAVTLTRAVRQTMGIDPAKPRGRWTKPAFAAGLTWIGIHVLTRWV